MLKERMFTYNILQIFLFYTVEISVLQCYVTMLCYNVMYVVTAHTY